MINDVFMLSDIFELSKEKLNKTGIYCIFNIKNNKYYVGQTNSLTKYGGLFKRLERHIISLRKDEHYNILLQRAFNKYGENCFRFQILEICSEDQLTNKEIYWGTFYNSLSPDGYNFILGEESRSFSYCTKQKMSKNHANVSGYNNPMCKWSKIDEFGGIDRIVKLKDSGLSIDKIANMIGVSRQSFYAYLSYKGLSWKEIGKYSTLNSNYEKINNLGGINKIIELKELGKSKEDVLCFFNVSHHSFDNFLKKNNVTWSNLGKYGNNTLFYYIDTVGGIKKIDTLIEKGYTKKRISDIIKVSTPTLQRYINFHKTSKKGGH